MFIKKPIFLIFCTVFVIGAAFSQKTALAKPLVFSLQPNTSKGKGSFAQGLPAALPSLPPIRLALVPASFSTAHWGFFCRKELQWEKNSKIPFRFRLGSMQQCDRLEGKRVAITGN